MQQFPNLFKLYDKKFRVKLDNEIAVNKEDNLFYKILYTEHNELLKIQLDRCCELIFSDKLIEDIYYNKLRLINFDNPDYTTIEPLFNELKVACFLDKLGYKLDFNIDRTQRSGEFYFNIVDKPYLIEVKTCQKRGNIDLKGVIKTKIKNCCRTINDEIYQDFSFCLNKLAITDVSNTVDLDEVKFKKLLKTFVHSIITNKADFHTIDFYYSQGQKLKIHVEVVESNIFKFLTPFYEIENFNYLFGILSDASEQIRYSNTGGFVVLFGNSSIAIDQSVLPSILNFLEPDNTDIIKEQGLSVIKKRIKEHFLPHNDFELLNMLDTVNFKAIIYIDDALNVTIIPSVLVEKASSKLIEDFFTSFKDFYKSYMEEQ